MPSRFEAGSVKQYQIDGVVATLVDDTRDNDGREEAGGDRERRPAEPEREEEASAEEVRPEVLGPEQGFGGGPFGAGQDGGEQAGGQSGGAQPGPGSPDGGQFGGGFFGGRPPIGSRDRFPLRDPTFWSGTLRILSLVAAGYWAAVVVPNAFSFGLGTFQLIELIGIPLFILGALLFRKWRLPEEPQAIRFEEERVALPKGADSTATTWVDYTDLRSIVLLSRGQGELVMIDTDEGRFTYGEADFAQPEGPRRVREELLQRARNHPKGDQILERMEHLETLARRASANPTSVTYWLLGLIGGIYLYEYMTGSLQGYKLIELGANSAPLIEHGQWWRLITANFLHGGWAHIILNGIALFFLGVAVERLIGSWRFLGIFLISALGGSLGSYLFTQAPLSVGSSTALFGLIAAFGVLHIKYWKQMPPPYRQSITWWVVILGLNVGVSFLPFVDAAGHFGGLLTGAAATFVATLGMKDFDPGLEAAGWWRTITGIFILVFAVGAGQGLTHMMKEDTDDQTILLEYQVEQGVEKQEPRSLNQAAWISAIDENASRGQLEIALRAAKKAVEMKPRPEFRDTLATVHYRLGLKASGAERKEHLGRAVQIERSVIHELKTGTDPESGESWTDLMAMMGQSQSISYYATQLARFLQSYANEYGLYRVGEAPPEELELTLTRVAGKSAVEADLTEKYDRDVEAFGLVSQEKQRLGIFRVCVPAGLRGGKASSFQPKGGAISLPEDAHLRKVYVSTDDAVSCGGEGLEAEFWPTQAQVRQLP